MPLLSGADKSNGVSDVVKNTRQIVTNTVEVLSPRSPLTPQGTAPAVKDTSMHMTAPAATKAAPVAQAAPKQLGTNVIPTPAKNVTDTATAAVPDAAELTAPLTRTVSTLQGQVPALQPVDALTSAAPAPAALPLAQPKGHDAEPIAVKSPGDDVEPIAIPRPGAGLPGLNGVGGLDDAMGSLRIDTLTDHLSFLGSSDTDSLPIASLIKACGSGAGGVVCNIAHNQPSDDSAPAADGAGTSTAADSTERGSTHDAVTSGWGPAAGPLQNIPVNGAVPAASPQVGPADALPLAGGSPLSLLGSVSPLADLDQTIPALGDAIPGVGGSGSPLSGLSLDTGGNNALPLAQPQESGSPLSALTGALPLSGLGDSLPGLGQSGSPLSALTGALPLSGLGDSLPGLGQSGSPLSALTGALPLDALGGVAPAAVPLEQPASDGALPLTGLLNDPNLVNVDPNSDVTGPFGSLRDLTGALSALGQATPAGAVPLAQPAAQAVPSSDAALPLDGVLHDPQSLAVDPAAAGPGDLAVLGNATGALRDLSGGVSGLDRTVGAAQTSVTSLRSQVTQVNDGGQGINTGLSGLDNGVPGLTGKDLSLTSIREAVPFIGIPTDRQDGSILPDASADLGKTLDLGDAAERAGSQVPGVPATVAGLSTATVPLPDGQLPGADDTSTALHKSVEGLKQGTDSLKAQTATVEDGLGSTGLEKSTSALGHEVDSLGLPSGASDLTGSLNDVSLDKAGLDRSGLNDVGLGDLGLGKAGLDELGLDALGATTLQHRVSELTSELGTDLGLLHDPVAHPLAEDSSAPVASLGDSQAPLASLSDGTSPLSVLGQDSPLQVLHVDQLPLLTGGDAGAAGIKGLDDLGLAGSPLSALPLAQPSATKSGTATPVDLPLANAVPGLGDLSGLTGNLANLSDLTGNLSGLTGGLDDLGGKGLSGLTGGTTAMDIGGLPL